MDRGTDSVGPALEQVGERWTFLILCEAFFDVRRFVDRQRTAASRAPSWRTGSAAWMRTAS
ncbi:hypothetical protein [Pseudonocardia sp. GCM10023141]|uniref:hypothetical protein n=1 Tax=Pseudonocardia sp. GCM10023141 TaxID=3252653 RepID=UPI003609FD72